MILRAVILASLCAIGAGCSSAQASTGEPVGSCSVTDGDTIRCGGERIRLLGIDAPEMSGCQQGRRCVAGDPVASKNALAAQMRGSVSVRRVGQDRYGRTLGVVYAGGQNLSCAQIAGGHAIYRGDWDNAGAVRRDCPSIAL